MTTSFHRDHRGYWAEQDPAELLDWSIDWSARTGADPIVHSVWSADAGITLAAPSTDGAVTTAWLSGSERGTYEISNTVTTQGGRTHCRRFRIIVQEARR